MDIDANLLERVRGAISMGGAVCLVGAGFSASATDQQDKCVPSTQELIREIKAATGIDSDEDATLTSIADYCEENPIHQHALRKLLVGRLTLCKPSNTQKVLVNQPWRSIFTTNFDDTVERCLSNGTYQLITPTSTSSTRITGRLPLYYLHGRANDLIESDKEPRIVISERNYLNLRDENRDLYAQLKNELFCANLVVIIGYSIRDLDIARIILDPGYAFRSKTVIICSPIEGQLSVSRLRKFGQVISVGADRLAAELTNPQRQIAGIGYQFLEEMTPSKPADEIEGDDFIKLILTGSFSHSEYQAQLQADHGRDLYCIRRNTALNIIMDRVEGANNRFVVSSDLGNGKSVFLDQLANELMAAGYQVIRVSSRLHEIFAELEKALSARKQTAFLIDDVIRYRNVAQFIGARLNAYCLLVCSTRADSDDIAFKELTDLLGGAVRQIDLNILTLDELRSWDVALERWGLWEQRISLTFEERLTFLSRECGSENRSIVLSLFRNSRIAAKIDQVVNFFLRDGDYSRAFAALLTSSLCQQHVSWESLVSWLELDEERLRTSIRRSEIVDLFSSGRNWNVFTSAQLAEHILRTRYVSSDRDTLVDVFSTIVIGTAESANDTYLGAIFRENLKELMKFRFLTRLFGDDAAANQLINRVYKRLSNAPFIRRNPQFWLQYAMSRMEVDDLGNAETYLNTALGLATQKGREYSPFQILDQRARLYLRKNSAVPGRFNSQEVKSALNDLESLLKNPSSEVIYTLRAVPLIRDFVEAKIDQIDKELRAVVLNLLERMKVGGEGFDRLPRSRKGETKELHKALNEAVRILRLA